MAVATPGESQAPAVATPAFAYADLADLGLAAPVAAHVRIAEAIALKDARAAGVAPGLARFYVEADIVSLIRGAQGIAGAGPLSRRPSARLRPAARRSCERAANIILFAEPVAGPPGRASPDRARRPARTGPRSRPTACARSSAKPSGGAAPPRDHRHRPRLPRARARCRARAKPRFSFRPRTAGRCRSTCFGGRARRRAGRWR